MEYYSQIWAGSSQLIFFILNSVNKQLLAFMGEDHFSSFHFLFIEI